MNIAVQSSLPIHDVERICNKISHELKENIDVTHKGSCSFSIDVSCSDINTIIKFKNLFEQYSRQSFLRNLCLEVDSNLVLHQNPVIGLQ